ncbi:hypothetical protein RJ639_037789 [Escallonia herrerae]|uniref:Uncharacterized protein n=1 Tax=Escallonia herrerae TaxID=1293975 RepID=A0AA88WJI5_9ASTE|nr:hypothetical protein RJ639_037789 [Escallonia herrerae]
MCYPAAIHNPVGSCKQGSGGWHRLVVPAATAMQEDRRQEVPAEIVTVAAGGGGGAVKQCLCSPTLHPGSFKCRYHHREYQWPGRLGPNGSYQPFFGEAAS